MTYSSTSLKQNSKSRSRNSVGKMVFTSRSLNQMLLLIQWDLTKIVRRVIFVIMRATWFAVQVTLFGIALSYMISTRNVGLDPQQYYKFYLLGIYTSILFSITASRAYDIAEEFEEGIIEYQLSLPINRKVLAIGRAIGGGIASTIFTLPMFFTVVVLANEFSLTSILLSLSASLLFSVGIAGMVISITLSIKSGDATDILMGALDAILVRLSTIFYPSIVLRNIAPYYYAALVNPVSHLADLLRIFYSFEDFKFFVITNPLAMACYIIGLAVGVSVMTMHIIESKLEGGGWR
jgi:ABC-2 type transport system permease protein